jgi:hypothetical protein
VRIIGPPSADQARVAANLTAAGAVPLFLGQILPALWQAAVALTVDPVGVVAQSFKETGGGAFQGKVSPDACNPCGLKIRVLGIYGPPTAGDEPGAHAIFPSWQVGAVAHVQHLRSYAGWPVDGLIVDPRYALALKGPRDWCENFEDLGGKWAPDLEYGRSVVYIARRLQA